jgi:hypothetical protein
MSVVSRQNKEKENKMNLYYGEKTLRETNSGKRFVSYRFCESFGRETREAHSWGCREKRGGGLVWLNPNETLDEGIARRNAANY